MPRHQAVWGPTTRTNWIRHLAHCSDRARMLARMDGGNIPLPVCHTRLPLAADPWLILLSVEEMMKALDVGDKVCKRCQAHVGVYQIGYQLARCDVCRAERKAYWEKSKTPAESKEE